MTNLALLPDRSVIALGGKDRVAFLQGLVSNDVTRAAPGNAVWAALLTPQGKWLADFFILADDETLFLDCERAQLADLIRRLTRFRLRANVTIADATEGFFVHAAWPDAAGIDLSDAISAPDPRLSEAGWRILDRHALAANATETDWDRHRLVLGLPDGSRDLEAEKTVLLEAGFDALNGVSWTKGCYMGQELTARTKYRGLVKRRLIPVMIEGPAPPPGTPVFAADREIGTMRSARDAIGLALLRIEADAPILTAGEATLVPKIPAWMNKP